MCEEPSDSCTKSHFYQHPASTQKLEEISRVGSPGTSCYHLTLQEGGCHNIDKVLYKESQHFLWLDFVQQVSGEFKVSSIVLGAGGIKKNKTSLLPSKCLKTSD